MMMQLGVRNKTYYQSENLLHLCFSEHCPHTAWHQQTGWTGMCNQAGGYEWCTKQNSGGATKRYLMRYVH